MTVTVQVDVSLPSVAVITVVPTASSYATIWTATQGAHHFSLVFTADSGSIYASTTGNTETVTVSRVLQHPVPLHRPRLK